MIEWEKISLKELAGYVSEQLRKRGIDTVLVGGACVTIYSENRYQSYDLDYVTYDDMRKVKKILLELGPAGLAASLVASQQNLSVTLIKRRDSYTREQKIFLKEDSLKFLKKLGIELQIPTFELNKQPQGIIKIKDLENALYQKVQEAGIKVLSGQFKSFDGNLAVIEPPDHREEKIQYDLLVGADGAHSKVRESLNIPIKKLGVDTLAASAIIAHTKPTTSMTEIKNEQYFLRNVVTPAESFILLHNKNNKLLKADKESMISTLKENNLSEEATTFELGKMSFMVENVRVSLQQAESFVHPELKAILIGDATATGSFFLGRGANLAFQTVKNAKKFLKMKRSNDPNAYSTFNEATKKTTDELIRNGKHLFTPITDTQHPVV
jgi:2-polyprenyl-6-methoxyphenol hydroxylase-like FAD-dependent oxidoreductase